MKLKILFFFIIISQYAFADLSDILEKALPAVVTVGIKSSKSENFSEVFGIAEKNPSDIAYNRLPDMSGLISSGSGFVIKVNGKLLVITNAHVIDGISSKSEAVVVFSINQTEYKVKLLGADSFYDIAVLEFVDNPGTEISFLNFSNDIPRIGTQVYAIGNPLGEFPYTITDGIISGKNRLLDGLTAKYGYLQTNAALIWGNSGGPLINLKGEVVGINTRIHVQEMLKQQIIIPQLNFALEASVAKRAVNDIIKLGKVQRCYLGIIISQDFRIKVTKSNEKINQYPVISGIIPGSYISEETKLLTGAEILEINDVKIRNIEEVLGSFEEALPNVKLKIKYRKNNKESTVTLNPSPLDDNALNDIAKYYFKKYLNAELKEKEETVQIVKSGKEETTKKFMLKEYEKREKDVFGEKEYKIPEKKINSVIVAAGWQEKSWKINSIKDLGVALRISLINGGIHYILSDNSSGYNLLWLDEEKDIASKTLIY